MLELIASIPLWVALLGAMAGGAVIYYGNRRVNEGLRSTGLLVASLAVLLGAAHFLIDTDAQRCERRTWQIVDCADKHDWARLQTLLDEHTRLDLAGQGNNVEGAAAITQAGQAAANSVGLRSVSVFVHRTQQVDNQITVTFSAATVQDQTQGRPEATGWEFDYHDVGGVWRLAEIKLLSVGTQQLQ